MAGTVRYWDGKSWTEKVAPANEGKAVETNDVETLNWGHWLMVFIFPILGIVFGIIKLGKNPRLGAQLFGITLLALIVWAMVISYNG